MEVQRLLASFPCCSGIKPGVPGVAAQKHRMYFSHSLGTAYGSEQLAEFVGQWFGTVGQILVVLSVAALFLLSMSVCKPYPTTAEYLHLEKEGELESFRSFIFAKRCNRKPQMMVSSAFCT